MLWLEPMSPKSHAFQGRVFGRNQVMGVLYHQWAHPLINSKLNVLLADGSGGERRAQGKEGWPGRVYVPSGSSPHSLLLAAVGWAAVLHPNLCTMLSLPQSQPAMG